MEDLKTKPNWMNDPSVKSIDSKKLEFIQKIYVDGNGKGKSQKEMMAFLMPLLKKAKEENLTFTPAEMSIAIAAIKKYSSPEEVKKINDILEKNQKP